MISRTPFKLYSNGAMAIVSGDERRRYFLLDNYRCLDKDIKFVLISCNPASVDGQGTDKTAPFIDQICRHHNRTPYIILNLQSIIGSIPGNVEKEFDERNFAILEGILDNTQCDIWTCWGGKKTIGDRVNLLFPQQMKDLLKKHSDRLVRVDINVNENGRYPVHPTYLWRIRKRFLIENYRFVPFDVQHLDAYY